MHARADIVDSVDFKVSKVKSLTIKTKEQKIQKRKQYDNVEVEGEALNSDQNFRKVLEEDTSNRSSSGSVISYSESCAHFGSTDATDFTGPKFNPSLVHTSSKFYCFVSFQDLFFKSLFCIEKIMLVVCQC